MPAPVVTTERAGNRRAHSALLRGTVDPNGLATTAHFEYKKQGTPWEPRVNYCPNPYAAVNAAQWTSGSANANATAEPLARSTAWGLKADGTIGLGGTSFRMTGETVATGSVILFCRTPTGLNGAPTVPGEIVRASAYMRSIDPSASLSLGFRLVVRWYNAAGGLFAVTNSPEFPDEGVDGQRIDVSAVAPAEAVFWALDVDIVALGVSGDKLDFEFTAVLMEKSTSLGDFFPTPAQLESGAAIWLGTPHASASELVASVSQTEDEAVGEGEESVDVAERVSGLQASTAYVYRLVAENAEGTAVGLEVEFSTTAERASAVVQPRYPDWLWVLQDAGGQTLSVLSGAQNRKLSYKRSSTPEATFDLELEHADSFILQEAVLTGGGGPPRLRCFRVEPQSDSTELGVCRFAGIVSSLDEKAGADSITVTARGAFEILEGRLIEVLFARDLYPVADTAVELIEEANGGWPTGIVIGEVEATEARDVTYEERKSYADGILDLIDVFDFEVVPLADETGQGVDLGRFDAWVRQGVDRPEAVFGYGEDTVGNCDDATRKTLPPRNRVWVTGAEELVGLAEDLDSQSRYGVWEYVEAMSDVLDQGILDDRAQALLSPGPLRVVTFTPNPSKVAEDGTSLTPKPWLDYWLGDTVRLSVRKGSFLFDGAPRIDGVDIDIDDEGFESSHSLVVSEETTGRVSVDPSDPVPQILELAGRLERLERRSA